MSFRGLEGASFPVTECLLRFRVGFRSSLQVHLPLVEKRKKRGERRSVNRFVVADCAIINSIQGRSITPRKTFSKIQRNRYSIYRFLQNELHVLSKKKKKKIHLHILSQFSIDSSDTDSPTTRAPARQKFLRFTARCCKPVCKPKPRNRPNRPEKKREKIKKEKGKEIREARAQKGRRGEEKERKRKKKDELSSRSSLSVLPLLDTHFRGQETGPAITHSCICHELNLVIGYIRSPISFLEQQVSLMNDHRGGRGGEGSASRGDYVSVITDRRGERSTHTPRTIVYPRGGSKS